MFSVNKTPSIQECIINVSQCRLLGHKVFVPPPRSVQWKSGVMAQSSGSRSRMKPTLPDYGFTRSPLSVTTCHLPSLIVPPPPLGLCFLLMASSTRPGEVSGSTNMVGNKTSDGIQLSMCYLNGTGVTAIVDSYLSRTPDMETFRLASLDDMGLILHL